MSPVPEVVVFCGLQGSGKSTFYRERFAATHALVSRDQFRNHRRPARRQAALIEGALREGRSVVVDNTNPTPADRAAIVAVARAHGARVRCFHFGRDVRAAIARNAGRAGKERVPVVGILATAKRLVAPTVEEGFDELWHVEARRDGTFAVTLAEPDDRPPGAPASRPARDGGAPELDPASPWRPWLFLAAHPDDETIGAGGLLARLRSAVVVHLTDGVPRDRRYWPEGLSGPSWEYARLRREELAGALDAAGLVAPLAIGLGAPDQEAALQLGALVERLEAILAEHRPGILVTHPYEGGHPDHDAAAFVAHAAVERLRRRGDAAPLLVEMTSYHARGAEMEAAAFLAPRGREVVRALPEELRVRKQRMLAAYGSQRDVLRAFGIGDERFRRAPGYDFTRAPGPEPLLYERWSFPITGRRWRELAASALRDLGLGHHPSW